MVTCSARYGRVSRADSRFVTHLPQICSLFHAKGTKKTKEAAAARHAVADGAAIAEAVDAPTTDASGARARRVSREDSWMTRALSRGRGEWYCCECGRWVEMDEADVRRGGHVRPAQDHVKLT